MKWDAQVEEKVQVTAGWCQMVFTSVSECFQVRLDHWHALGTEKMAEHQQAQKCLSLLPTILAGLKCLVHTQSTALVFC